LKNSFHKLKTLPLLVLAVLVFAMTGASAQSDEVFSLDIEPQQAGSALVTLAKSSGMQILFANGAGAQVEVEGLKGEYRFEEALAALLTDTGLEYEFASENLVLVQQTQDAGELEDMDAAEDAAADDIEEALEEIIVTARKREESLQDVPLSISVFSAADIKSQDIGNIRDLSRLTPSFNFPDLGQRYIDSPVIRGVAGNDADPTKQSASFFVDGVYVSGSAQNINFHDIDRIEVIKGPQSAQFGRATFAGAINFITRDPTDELAGSVEIKGAQHDEYEVSASLSGPLVEDRVFFRINGRHWNYGGEWENAGLPEGIALGGISSTNIGGSLLFTPNETLRVRARLEFIRDDDGPSAIEKKAAADHNCMLAVSYICGEVEVDDNRLGATYDEFVADGYEPGLVRDTWRSSLQLEWDFDNVTLSGTAAFNDEEMLRAWDVITELSKARIFVGFGGAAPGSYGGQIVNDFRFEDYSVDVRLQSNTDEPLQWTIGGYIADLDQRFGRVRGAIVLDPPNRRTVKNQAIFGALSYTLSDQLAASIEGRYQSEELARLNINTGDVITLASGVTAKETFSTFLPRFTLSLKPNADLTIYGQAAKGNKPGDFNTGTTIPADYAVLGEEELWNYEIGAKGATSGNRFTWSVAVFWMDIENQQVRDVTPEFQLLTRNTGAARSRGVEVEAALFPLEGLTLRGAFGYADHEFTNFPSDADSAAILGDGDAKGRTSRSTPKTTGWLSASYRAPLSSGLDWFLRGAMVYRSKVYATAANVAHSGDLAQVHVRAGVEAEQWTAEIFARNLLDNQAIQRISPNFVFANFPFSIPRVVTVFPSRGRQVGFRLSYEF